MPYPASYGDSCDWMPLPQVRFDHIPVGQSSETSDFWAGTQDYTPSGVTISECNQLPWARNEHACALVHPADQSRDLVDSTSGRALPAYGACNFMLSDRVEMVIKCNRPTIRKVIGHLKKTVWIETPNLLYITL